MRIVSTRGFWTSLHVGIMSPFAQESKPTLPLIFTVPFTRVHKISRALSSSRTFFWTNLHVCNMLPSIQKLKSTPTLPLTFTVPFTCVHWLSRALSSFRTFFFGQAYMFVASRCLLHRNLNPHTHTPSNIHSPLRRMHIHSPIHTHSRSHSHTLTRMHWLSRALSSCRTCTAELTPPWLPAAICTRDGGGHQQWAGEEGGGTGSTTDWSQAAWASIQGNSSGSCSSSATRATIATTATTSTTASTTKAPSAGDSSKFRPANRGCGICTCSGTFLTYLCMLDDI